MSDLTSLERRKLERWLGMGGGYVLNFSNRTISEFFHETVQRNIYDQRYAFKGDSKANRMRAFWEVESNHLVSRLIGHLLDLVVGDNIQHTEAELADARAIMARLKADTGVAEVAFLAELGDSRDFEAVAIAVRDAIEQGKPAVGLDRLHTFATKYLRSLCEKAGISVDRNKALHALMGEYRRYLHDDGKLESVMTGKILKAAAQLFQDFNDVRNDQSLAHDNPILNHDEALLIFNTVTSCIRFLREMERRLERDARTPQQTVAENAEDDIPF